MTDSTALSNMILPIVTALVGGGLTLAGVWLSNKNSRRLLALQLDRADQKTHNEVLRSRLEELYEVTGKWANSYVSHHTLFRTVMEGGITYNDALDIHNSQSHDDSSSRMFTLGELYFDECRDLLDEIKRLRDLASDIQSDFKEHYKQSGMPSERHRKALTEALTLSVDSINSYKARLSTYAQKV